MAFQNAFDLGPCTVQVTNGSLGTILFSQVMAKGQSATFGNSTVDVSSTGVVSLSTTDPQYNANLKVIPSYDVSNAGIRASGIAVDGSYSNFAYAFASGDASQLALAISTATQGSAVTPDPADLSAQLTKTLIGVGAGAQ